MNWLFLTTVKALMRVCFALFIDPTEKAHDNLSCKVTSVEAITDTVYRVRIVQTRPFLFVLVSI